MCTLTYIPFHSDHRIITSNRDESRLRLKATPPEIYNLHDKKVLFPKDPVGGGTWIATADDGVTACLLNGAFKPHIPASNYKKSRGLVVLEVFCFNNPFEFCKKVNLLGIEPFSLVIFKNDLIIELKWTGITKHIIFYDPALPIIWASAQLYSLENILKRKVWFAELLKENNLSQQKIINFHMTAGDGDKENDLIMKRTNSVQTISITSVEIKKHKQKLFYKDLISKTETITYLY